MRLRNIPGAKDAITGSNYVVQEPASHKGKWAQVFPKDQPLHIEVGMGKGYRRVLGNRSYVGPGPYGAVHHFRSRPDGLHRHVDHHPAGTGKTREL